MDGLCEIVKGEQMAETNTSDNQRWPVFLFFTADEGMSLLNLHQVRLVDQIRDTHCRIFFSEDHIVELHGEGATQVVALLITNAITSDGTPVPSLIAKEDPLTPRSQ